jgi:transglutaminase/protease-like cytokinesis protein 3
MKNISKTLNITLLFLLVFGFTSHAQDFEKVDNTVKAYPKSFATLDKFATQINKDFMQDNEKARAIFTWIALNVKYDLAAFNVTERPIAYSYKTQEERQLRNVNLKTILQ